ncbi:MAG: hypothetical protein B5M54_11020 [Candidatus Aminicenantes bacterium 4484_214]|nr:MAG: hypothetical protein B5M54_11020 [Candidatus Aminicenantes bacterium 4484_214]
MTRFNIDRIRYLIGEINSAFYKLEKIRKISKEEFLKSQEKIDSSKYNLIIIIEGAIDICNHIVARAGGRAPTDYGDCFAILGELEILSPELVEKLKKMAKFRNLLVHLYWKVDNQRVFNIIQKDINDIKLFLLAIKRFINQSER